MRPPEQKREAGWWRRRARLLGGVATAGAIAVAAAAVLAPPPASAQAQARPPAPDRVSAASRPARDGPITPAGLGSPPATTSSPAAGAPVAADPCRTRAGPARPIALNSASQAELEELPGIGPAKALRILDWRGKHGRFRRIVDLRRVKGFGRKTVMRLAPYLVLDAPPVTTPSSRPANTPLPVAGSK